MFIATNSTVIFVMTKRSRSSQHWLDRHRKDEYSRRARKLGHVSRAHFKLEQLDQRFKLLSGVNYALELGGAPGGWTSYIENNLEPNGKLITVDPLEVRSGPKTIHIQGLAGTKQIDSQILDILDGIKLDIVLSDMAPNISGIKIRDQAEAMNLAFLALSKARLLLKKGGALALKSFQNPDISEFLQEVKKCFGSVRIVKPPASRSQSSEVYVVAKAFRFGSNANWI